jgi:hypothetical protein
MAGGTKLKPIHLHFKSQETVVVVPDDEDRFVLTAGEAALACKQAKDSQEWNRQWNDFLFHIHQWCKAHESEVDTGYVTVGDSALNVLIGARGEDYNFDIEDALADLDLELANEFPLCVAEVMQVPDQRHLRGDLSGDAILVVYGEGQRARAAGRT